MRKYSSVAVSIPMTFWWFIRDSGCFSFLAQPFVR